MTKGKDLVTIPEAAELEQLSVARVRALAAQGRIVGATKPGRDWLIPVPMLCDPPLDLSRRGNQRGRLDKLQATKSAKNKKARTARTK